MIAVRSGVECRLLSEGGAASDPMAEIPSFLGHCQVGDEQHVFLSYSSFTEDYLLHGPELAPSPQQLPSPVLLAHQTRQSALLVTPRSILVLSPVRCELPLPFEAELAAADKQFVVCANRGDVAVLAVEEGTARVLCQYTTEYDVGCVEVKTTNEGCVVFVGEWVANRLHIVSVVGGSVSHVVKKEFDKAIMSVLITDVPTDTRTETRAETRAFTRFVVVSENDGTVVVLRECDEPSRASDEWVEEKRLRASRLPLQWVRTRDPALVLGVGEKTCLLYYKNKNWL